MKTIVTVLVAMLAFNSVSQAQKTYLVGHAGTQSSLLLSDFRDSYSYSNIGYNFGIGIHKISELGFYFQSGIGVCSKSLFVERWNRDFLSSFSRSTSSNYTFHYIEVPVTVGMRVGQPTYFDFGIGLAGQALLNARKHVTSFDFRSTFIETNEHVSNAFPFQIGYLIRIELGREFQENYTLGVRGVFLSSALSALKGSGHQNFILRNPGLQITFGYDFFK